ncbi:MAG: DUF2924 domain-containing protein [Methylocella sp.]
MGTVSGHGFHPPKAQLPGQFHRPQLSGLRSAAPFAHKPRARLQRNRRCGLSRVVPPLQRLSIQACAESIWRGCRAAVTHTVLVHSDGVEWNGRRYRSLTIVAREITGAHWSGPCFFGLRTRAVRSVESAEGDHAEA